MHLGSSKGLSDQEYMFTSVTDSAADLNICKHRLTFSWCPEAGRHGERHGDGHNLARALQTIIPARRWGRSSCGMELTTATPQAVVSRTLAYKNSSSSQGATT